MAVALANLPPQIPNRSTPQQVSTGSTNIGSKKASLRLVANSRADFARSVASKAAFEAGLSRALANKKFWDELLERLRKSGGGGGGLRKFDKIMTSLMFMNFLSNKQIQAMMNNFKLEYLKLMSKFSNKIQALSQNPFIQGLQKLSTFIFSGLAFATVSFAKSLRLQNIPKALNNFTNGLNALASMVSFQMNKLKEVLEEQLKEIIKRLDVKEKMRKIKTTLMDFFVEMKEEILNSIESLKAYIEINISKVLRKIPSAFN